MSFRDCVYVLFAYVYKQHVYSTITLDKKLASFYQESRAMTSRKQRGIYLTSLKVSSPRRLSEIPLSRLTEQPPTRVPRSEVLRVILVSRECHTRHRRMRRPQKRSRRRCSEISMVGSGEGRDQRNEYSTRDRREEWEGKSGEGQRQFAAARAAA